MDDCTAGEKAEMEFLKVAFAIGAILMAGGVPIAAQSTETSISMVLAGGRNLRCVAGNDDAVYFAHIPDTPGANRQLYKTDGTPDGTVMIEDMNTLPARFYNNRLYFGVENANNEWSLWSTDGSVGGATLLKDSLRVQFSPDGGVYGYSKNWFFGEYKGHLYFWGETSEHGTELWRTDGTSSGTIMLKEFSPGPESSYPCDFTTFSGHLYFRVYFPFQIHSQLWRTDGTIEGTMRVGGNNVTVPATYMLNQLVVADDVMYFIGADTVAINIFKTDGTDSGTTYVVPPGFPSTPFQYPGIFYKGHLYYSGYTSTHGTELWRTDGTSSGTTLFKEIADYHTFSSIPHDFKVLNDKLLFNATDNLGVTSTWISDGTPEGTLPLLNQEFLNRQGTGPMYYTEFDGRLYFSANGNGFGRELWTTDGTREGTYRVADINPGTESSEPRHFAVTDSAFYFVATGPEGLEALWKVEHIEPGQSRINNWQLWEN